MIATVTILCLDAEPARALHAALPLIVPSSTLSTVEFSLDNYVELRTLAPGRIPLWPRWSRDAERIGFAATDVDLMQGHAWLTEIWVMDVAAAHGAVRLLTEAQGATCHSLSFVPDDSSLLFQDDIPNEYGGRPSLCDANTPGVERRLGLSPTALDPTIASGIVYHTDIRQTPGGYMMAVDLYKRKSLYRTTSVYIIPTDASGVPNLSLKKEIIDDLIGGSPCRLALSPTGNELLLSYFPGGYGNGYPNVLLVTGLARIISGEDLPIKTTTDPRIKTFADGPHHADAPSFSEDGSLIFYGYDFDGRFNMIDMNFEEANFDVMVVRLEDALAGNLTPTRLQLPGNQGCICASNGGTRFAFAQTGTPGNKICATGLTLSEEVVVNETGSVEEPFELKDGARTVLRMRTAVVVHNYIPGDEPLRISMRTPVPSLRQNVLPTRTVGMPVQRTIRHNNRTPQKTDDTNGLSFDPPADLDIAYLDAEIRGLDENDLLVYAYTPQTGKFDRFLPLTAHDLDANLISVQLQDVAPIESIEKTEDGLADGSLAVGVADSDGDGISDGREIRWDGNLGMDVYNPDANPAGADLDPFNPDTDGDGSPDGQEASFNFDPLDANDTPELPAAGPAGLLLLGAALIAAGIGVALSYPSARLGLQFRR
jgi:hypothetical protein